MTYSLPFGLDKKPLTHPMEHGQVIFNMRNGVMHFRVQYKKRNRVHHTVVKGIIETKGQLDYLLHIKEFPVKLTKELKPIELTSKRPTIEVVSQ